VLYGGGSEEKRTMISFIRQHSHHLDCVLLLLSYDASIFTCTFSLTLTPGGAQSGRCPW
jgi:hypothetical protein